MTTLAANALRVYEGDVRIEESALPVIASDIVYEGAAVGVVDGTGHTRPLVGGDRFVGFCYRKADNSAGAAGDINVTVRTRGKVLLAISALAITANDRPAVYASDDDTFTLTAGGSLVGTVLRSRHTLRIVKQNLVWAAVYNAACVPLALVGWLPAWAAGLGMALSSLLVVLNALRLSKDLAFSTPAA